jgi:hypothetical protein
VIPWSGFGFLLFGVQSPRGVRARVWTAMTSRLILVYLSAYFLFI